MFLQTTGDTVMEIQPGNEVTAQKNLPNKKNDWSKSIGNKINTVDCSLTWKSSLNSWNFMEHRGNLVWDFGWNAEFYCLRFYLALSRRNKRQNNKMSNSLKKAFFLGFFLLFPFSFLFFSTCFICFSVTFFFHFQGLAKWHTNKLPK